jgi:dipeptidyl-peptidase-4
VQALVIDVASGSLQRLSLPSQAEYVVRAGWLADGTPWLQWLTRDQTELHLVEFPDLAALPRTLWVEKESTWVDVHDDFLELESWPLSGKPSLLWSSERSGRRQLWQIDRVSGASHPLTQEPEPIGTVVCANAERIVFTGLRQRGRARELFERGRDGRTRVIDAGSERRWRGAKADAACERLLVRTSSWEHPPQLSLLTLSGRAPPQPLDGDLPDPQLLRTVPEVQSLDLPADDGVTTLNAFYLPPLRRSSSPAGHAVIVWAYGGPQAATVGWYWHAQEPLFATWQARGFGVLLVDTRGSDGRRRTFSHAHFRAFGQVEVADLFAAARALPKAVRGVDPKRIGLIGWSYGGFLAARAMLDDNTPFAAAVAGAPVVDWTLYDTAYTERYLGLPDGGAAPPYRDANLALRASHLTRPLLLMHGTSDDNVLFEHSLRLIAALESEGKLFDTVIYPGQTHGLASRRLRLHADRAATEFLVRQLQP